MRGNNLLKETHQKVMKVAADFLLLPEGLKKDLIRYSSMPDEEDEGVDRIMRHILIPIPGGHFGGALNAISKLMEGKDPVRNVAFASHYLMDICSPFHTSLYTFYRQGYHGIVEDYINKNLDEWLPEYSPHPPKIKSLERSIMGLAQESQNTANELLLGFAKFELLKGDYPDDLMKKILKFPKISRKNGNISLIS